MVEKAFEWMKRYLNEKNPRIFLKHNMYHVTHNIDEKLGNFYFKNEIKIKNMIGLDLI